MSKNFYLGFDRIKSEEDLQRASMSFDRDGHYPVGMSDCYVVGLNGDCGIDCPVFRRGDCGEPQEMYIGDLDSEEREEIESLYPENTFKHE